MQGRLRREPLSVDIETECGHCGRPLHLTVDSELNVHIHSRRAQILAFFPDVDWAALAEPTILNAY